MASVGGGVNISVCAPHKCMESLVQCVCDKQDKLGLVFFFCLLGTEIADY